jgi:two-component system chemotaxis response regulator CheY
MRTSILIVDDSALTRAVIAKTVRLTKFKDSTIREAPNGKEALAALRAEAADLVFSDINMPVMNGLEFLDTKNQDNSIRGIPVIVISSDHSSGRAEQLKQRGVQSIVSKPFTPEAIEKLMASVLEE